ncbi:MFS transporter [Eilatimonas milleporae]|uniref:Putative MFS family arabinose efflux permease n=1 Tax=Eilatimonas milleporae TaxID=911205 RepID=A0A3M0CS82_9PROT|nr:MFS transporter [Eilatimonas milleporae]RMB12392.1 putative MFS family arabinose efflux permease [Eilatimonas milleporae]
MTPTSASRPAGDRPEGVSSAPARRTGPAAWYALFVLFVAYTFSFIDRTILALLVEPLKQDLALSDTQVSLLHGFAFAIFYTTLGIPIARLADRMPRRTIIVWSVAVWSVATCLCGLAGRFAHLFLARVGVGAGEAGLSPAAYSMIADMFPRRLLGRALGLYSMGVYVGAGLAFLVGGAIVGRALAAGTLSLPLVGELKAWQAIFFIVGAPGLLVALLMLTVAEPPRKQAAPARTHRSLTAVFRFIAAEPGTFLMHFAGFSALGLLFNAFIAWSPSLLIRQMAFTTAEAGALLGLGILVFGSLGIVAGGAYSDWLERRGRAEAPLLTGRLAGVWLLFAGILLPLVEHTAAKAALVGLFFFWAAFPYAAAAAAIQIAAPPALRAQMSAVYLFCLNLVGIGVGATLVGVLTDYVFADPAALPWSMAVTAAISAPVGVLCLHLGCAPFRRSAAARTRENADAGAGTASETTAGSRAGSAQNNFLET